MPHQNNRRTWRIGRWRLARRSQHLEASVVSEQAPVADVAIEDGPDAATAGNRKPRRRARPALKRSPVRKLDGEPATVRPHPRRRTARQSNQAATTGEDLDAGSTGNVQGRVSRSRRKSAKQTTNRQKKKPATHKAKRTRKA